MKIPDEQKEIIYNGMLEMLDPEATEVIEEIKKAQGRNLIYNGVYKDKDGKNILPGVVYVYSEFTHSKINHKQKMGHIIEQAANQNEMTERLGEYLAKHAKDPNAVRQDAENKKKAAEKKEAERLAAMSDIERIDIYLNKLSALEQPTINDERLKAAWNLFEETRANAVTTLIKTLHLIQKK